LLTASYAVQVEKRKLGDDLDDFIARRTAQNPAFPKLVETAQAKRAQKRKPANLK
jgi:hypothetical protein